MNFLNFIVSWLDDWIVTLYSERGRILSGDHGVTDLNGLAKEVWGKGGPSEDKVADEKFLNDKRNLYLNWRDLSAAGTPLESRESYAAAVAVLLVVGFVGFVSLTLIFFPVENGYEFNHQLVQKYKNADFDYQLNLVAPLIIIILYFLFAYAVLRDFLNKTIFRFDGYQFTVKRGPVPCGKSLVIFPRESIKQLYVEQGQSSREHRGKVRVISVYKLLAVTKDNKKIAVDDQISQFGQALLLKQWFELQMRQPG